MGFLACASAWGWLDAGPFVPAWCRLLSFGTFLHGGFRGLEGVLEGLRFRPERVFRAPWRSTDLADFWGSRWNRFVGKTLALEVFAPTRRRFGRATAVLLTFFESGVLHEGLFRGSTEGPDGRFMAFFLIHGLAVLWMASRGGRSRTSARTRLILSWAILLASAPLFFGGCYPAVAPFERVFRPGG